MPKKEKKSKQIKPGAKVRITEADAPKALGKVGVLQSIDDRGLYIVEFKDKRDDQDVKILTNPRTVEAV